jgi:hypothetical protein
MREGGGDLISLGQNTRSRIAAAPRDLN